MPLSEHEQRLLDEMERSLYHNDTDFVNTSSSGLSRPNYRAAALGALIAIAGIGALVAGVITRLPVVGVIGFAVMFAGVLIALSPRRGSSSTDSPTQSRPTAGAAANHQAGFMDRLNERWDKRQDGTH